ncbi:hypothetical protein QAD02_000204 [Eretmocerus hayati]|uniref:Uncharacterized protein n=1 Tax=Eretmocerus hayati TaxID=131215 RepID=A0ACC2NCR2_9HYME|nr:hypothetical protein QAD02_000204 [Eretmocerus hayati]
MKLLDRRYCLAVQAKLWLMFCCALGLVAARSRQGQLRYVDKQLGNERRLLKALLPRSSSTALGAVDNSIVDDFADTAIVLMSDTRHSNFLHNSQRKPAIVVYQTGDSEEDLPECRDKSEVCSKVDLYGDPWVERQCRCASGRACSSSLHADDGHSIVDKTRMFKLCEPVKHLPVCRYFKDVTWTIAPGAGPNNATVQKVFCRCRAESIAYLVKRQYYVQPDGNPAFVYSFACSPQSRMRCQPKEPCRLFSVHKRPASQLEEVNASPLCQCSRGHRCPMRHTDPGSLPSGYYGESLGVKVYTGHCVPLRHAKEPVYTLV